MAFLRHSVLEDNVLLRCWVMYVTDGSKWASVGTVPLMLGDCERTQTPRAAWNPVRHWASCWNWASPPNLRPSTSHHSKWFIRTVDRLGYLMTFFHISKESTSV